jgi:hypothetical protein
LIDVCTRYDMPIIVSQVVHKLLPILTDAKIHLAFVTASKINSIELAIRILLSGHRHYLNKDARFPGSLYFDVKAVGQLRPEWVWALGEARNHVDRLEGRPQPEFSVFWEAFAGRLAAMLLRD